MATLFDKRKWLTFQLTPVAPVAGGPHSAYDAIVRERDQILFERRYTTYDDSPDGHWNVWRLFRALQLAETLADSRTPFDLTGRPDGEFNQPATLTLEVGWLDVILWADTLVHRHDGSEPRVERRSSVILYLLIGPQEMGSVSGDYRQFQLECLPADVVGFGQALEAECREALRLRRELGTLAPADDYIDE
jgi:hypothetical protein